MYTSHIGKKFLKYYNNKNDTEYSAESFFEEIMFPLFFDDPVYLMHVGNAPFFQLMKNSSIPEKRQEALESLKSKLKNGEINMSSAVGYPAVETTATTSGQLTNFEPPLDSDDAFASWIGAAFGIRIEGGYLILIDDEDVLFTLYDGWKEYREKIKQNPNLKGNQIESWNGHYISWVFNPVKLTAKVNPEIKVTSNVAGLQTKKWVQFIFALARKFPERLINSYVYKFGQTNSTLGYIQLKLPQVKKLFEVYDWYSGREEVLKNKQLEQIYDTDFGFYAACRNGSIGISQIQPKKLKDFLAGNYNQKIAKNTNKEEQIINYHLYIIWLAAMINDKNLFERAEETAELLLKHTKEAKRGKTDRDRPVEGLFTSGSKRLFIERLTEIMKGDDTLSDGFYDLVKDINHLPIETFRYFVTLLQFHFVFKQSKS